MKKQAVSKSGLEGFYFTAARQDKKGIAGQGQVLRNINDEMCLIQRIDLVDGRRSHCQLAYFKDMWLAAWRFYPTAKEMNDDLSVFEQHLKQPKNP